jgi:hypothetical protein
MRRTHRPSIQQPQPPPYVPPRTPTHPPKTSQSSLRERWSVDVLAHRGSRRRCRRESSRGGSRRNGRPAVEKQHQYSVHPQKPLARFWQTGGAGKSYGAEYEGRETYHIQHPPHGILLRHTHILQHPPRAHPERLKQPKHESNEGEGESDLWDIGAVSA